MAPAGSQSGGEVMRVRAGSPAERAGIQTGDRIVKLNGRPVSAREFQRTYGSLSSETVAELDIVRNGKPLVLKVAVEPMPKEKIQGAEVIYDSVRTPDGYRVRTVVTRPGSEPVSKRLPAIFLVPWLSCDSTESPFGPVDGTGKLLQALASRSGFVLMRTDKPGLGDSEGPSCEDVDFNKELAAYQAAFRSLKNYSFVDSDSIYLLGLSNGGGIAPLVAGNERVRGYVISGGWVKTWYEHMMEIERRRLALSGETPDRVNSHMAQFEEFYTEYLIEKQTPEQVIRKHPAFQSIWYDEPEHQYGRPAAFYQQLQDLNLAGAWQKVDSPVMVIYGEYDWIMSRSDHEMIADIVNQRHPGTARFVAIPKMDHGLTLQDSMDGSFRNFGGGRWDDSLATLIINWLKQN
jgi:pimeloyl-ACP methyl ester carboxylesterase